MAKKKRFMANMDPELYEWLRNVSHATRKSMSRVLNESVKQVKESGKKEKNLEVA